MRRYVVRRLVAGVPTLAGVALVVFALVRLLPGDPARLMAGPLAGEEEVERLRAQLGLGESVPLQLAAFYGRLLVLDLGRSARTGGAVLDEILARLPHTLELALLSMALATTAGVAAGILAAARHRTRVDYAVSAVAILGVSMPVYWLGLLLIVVFAVQLRLLPAAGADEPASVILPSLTLAAALVGNIARITRASMLEVLRQDHIRTARAKGLAEALILERHALRNALLPVITVVGLQFGTLLGGAVITESVFAWPGLGLLLVGSIFARDYGMVQGIVLVFAALFILVNIAVDVLYGYVDPRIRYE